MTIPTFTRPQLSDKTVIFKIRGVDYDAHDILSITPSGGTTASRILGARRTSRGIVSITNASTQLEIVFVGMDAALYAAQSRALANQHITGIAILVVPDEESEDQSRVEYNNVTITDVPNIGLGDGSVSNGNMTFQYQLSGRDINYWDYEGNQVL